jgi:flagellar biosynthesis chaperone FliJ
MGREVSDWQRLWRQAKAREDAHAQDVAATTARLTALEQRLAELQHAQDELGGLAPQSLTAQQAANQRRYHSSLLAEADQVQVEREDATTQLAEERRMLLAATQQVKTLERAGERAQEDANRRQLRGEQGATDDQGRRAKLGEVG